MADKGNSHFIEVVSGVMKLQNSIFIENEYVENKYICEVPKTETILRLIEKIKQEHTDKQDFLEKFKTELQHIEKEIQLKEIIKKEIIEKENLVDDNILSVSNMRKMARAHEHSLLHELEEEQNKTELYNIKYQRTISKYETLWQEYEDTYNNLSYVHERNQQKSCLKLLMIDLKKHEAQKIQINKKFQLLRIIQAKKKQNVILNLAELLTERNAFLQKKAAMIKEIEECKKKIEDMKAEKMQLFRTGIKRPYRPEIFGTGVSQFSVSIMDLMQNGLALQTPLWDSPPRKIICYNQVEASTGIRGESTPAASHSRAYDGRDTSLTSEQSAIQHTINTFQETMSTGNHDTIREHHMSDQPGAQGNEAHDIPQQYENPRSIIERDERLSSVLSEKQMLTPPHEQNLSSCSDTVEINEERSLEDNDIARTEEDGSLKNMHNRSQSSISTTLQIEEDTFEVSVERNNEKSTLNQEISQNKTRTTPILLTKTTDTRPTVHRQLQVERSSTQTTAYNRDKRCPNSQIILQRDGSMADQMQASLQREDRLPLSYTNTSMQRNGGGTVLQGITQRGNGRHMPLQDVPQRDYRSNQIQAEIQYEMRFTDGDQTANQQNILQGRRDKITSNNMQSSGKSLQNNRQNDGRSNATEDDLVRERDDFLPQNNGSGNHASRLICENDKPMTEINSVCSTAFQQTEQETENTSNFFQTSLNFAQPDLFPDCNRSGQTAGGMDPANDTDNNVELSPEPTMTTSEANREQSENSNAQSSSGCASEVGAVWEHGSEVDAFVPSPEGYTEGNFILNSPSISYEENALSPSASLIVSPEGNDNCNTVNALQGLDNQNNNTNTGFSFNFGSSTSNFMSNMSSIFQRNNGTEDNTREQSKKGGIFSLF